MVGWMNDICLCFLLQSTLKGAHVTVFGCLNHGMPLFLQGNSSLKCESGMSNLTLIKQPHKPQINELLLLHKIITMIKCFSVWMSDSTLNNKFTSPTLPPTSQTLTIHIQFTPTISLSISLKTSTSTDTWISIFHLHGLHFNSFQWLRFNWIFSSFQHFHLNWYFNFTFVLTPKLTFQLLSVFLLQL